MVEVVIYRISAGRIRLNLSDTEFLLSLMVVQKPRKEERKKQKMMLIVASTSACNVHGQQTNLARTNI